MGIGLSVIAGYAKGLSKPAEKPIPQAQDTADSPNPSPEAFLPKVDEVPAALETLKESAELPEVSKPEEPGPVIPSWLGDCATDQEIRDLQQHGTRPKSFTKKVVCKICGPVFEEAWVDDNPEVCRWCRGTRKPVKGKK